MWAQSPHLVLLPELLELIVVDGKLDEVQIIALNAEIQVPEPEHETDGSGWGGGVSGVPRIEVPNPACPTGLLHGEWGEAAPLTRPTIGQQGLGKEESQVPTQPDPAQ